MWAGVLQGVLHFQLEGPARRIGAGGGRGGGSGENEGRKAGMTEEWWGLGRVGGCGGGHK